MKKLLRVTTPTACAVAILTQTGSAWTVTRTGPSLAWMRGLDMPAIKQRLQADGAKWEWLEVSEQFAQIAGVRQAHPPGAELVEPGAELVEARTRKATKPTPAANVTPGEQRVFTGIQNAIKADARDKAIVRNARSKRKKEIAE